MSLAVLVAAAPSPPPSEPASIYQRAPDCTQEIDTLCKRVYDLTGESWLGHLVDFLVAKPLKIALILLVALVVRSLLHRAVTRLTARVVEGSVPDVLAKGPSLLLETPLLSERRRQHAATTASVVRSAVTGVVFAVAFVMVLSELDINVAPLLASASIIGVALGIGAQALVRDVLSGMFMILEDQYGVGDVVDLDKASGTVESVGLRVTRLRDDQGVVWYVRNGEVLRVGNKSQGLSTAAVDVPVAYDEDISRVQALVTAVAADLAADEQWRDRIVQPPDAASVESFTGDTVVLRVALTCAPNEAGAVQPELRQRLKQAFDREGVRVPVPARS